MLTAVARDFLTLVQAAQILGLPPWKLRRAADRGVVKMQRVGAWRAIAPDDIDDVRGALERAGYLDDAAPAELESPDDGVPGNGRGDGPQTAEAKGDWRAQAAELVSALQQRLRESVSLAERVELSRLIRQPVESEEEYAVWREAVAGLEGAVAAVQAEGVTP